MTLRYFPLHFREKEIRLDTEKLARNYTLFLLSKK